MTTDFRTRLAHFLTLPDEELSRPLWEVPWNDRKAFLSARTRRQFVERTPDEFWQEPEAHQRVTDWAETE